MESLIESEANLDFLNKDTSSNINKFNPIKIECDDGDEVHNLAWTGVNEVRSRENTDIAFAECSMLVHHEAENSHHEVVDVSVQNSNANESLTKPPPKRRKYTKKSAKKGDSAFPKKAAPKLSKEERLNIKHKQQYATWTDRPDPNFTCMVESESDIDNSAVDADSDFATCNKSGLENNSVSGDSCLEGEEVDIGEEEKLKGARVKETSVFTLGLIAKILDITVNDLDAEKWNRNIKEVSDSKMFQKLITLNLKAGLRRYKCYKCDSQVRGTTEDLESHMRDSHELPLAFGCFFCPLARLTERDLRMHEQRHVNVNQTEVCILCDTFHKRRLEVDWTSLHAQCHPPMAEVAALTPEAQAKIYERCAFPNCFSGNVPRFLNIVGLVGHAMTYHLSGNSVCDICGVGEMSKWKLKRHRVHCAIKKKEPQKCELCGSRKKNLLNHNCGGKFDCEICASKFTSNNSRLRHQKNVHGTKNESCQICDRKFVDQKQLQDHMNTHTGTKPYQCLACGKWHTSQAGLAMHLRSRHDLTTRQMRDKYKNCPVADPSSEEDTEKPLKVQTETKTYEYNMYTGRKRGRPKVQRPIVDEQETESAGGVGTVGHPFSPEVGSEIIEKNSAKRKKSGAPRLKANDLEQ